jgi:arylsulfatase A-like enzyme
MRKLIVLLLLAALSISMSCGSDQRPLNVVLIGVDTLRRDHVGCYGYERPTTANIDRLAAGGVLFEDAVSQSPWTLPSFCTIHTSLYPTQHGAGGFERSQGTFGNRMSGTVMPLAMVLLKNGYATGAIINAPALAPDFGVDKGFEFYDTSPRWDPRVADGTTEDALKWIDSHSEGPFFMFVHYFDPHLPYSPPEPYDKMYDSDYSGPISSSFDRETFNKVIPEIVEKGGARAEAEWDHVRALYDGEITFTDKAVGALLEGLEERGLKENTLVVFVSDHGEEFYEHGGFEHGHTMYDELIKVPLMFSLPGEISPGKRISRQVRMMDVMPTILDYLGICSLSHMEGASLRPLISGEGEPEDRTDVLLPHKFAYSEAMLYGSEKKCITAFPWKVVYDLVSAETMVFDLGEDPAELSDLAESEPPEADLLQEVLFQTLLNISDTWYIELGAGGEEHSFDLDIDVGGRASSGHFQFHTLMDSEGRLIGEDLIGFHEVSRRAIRLRDIRLDTSLKLAVKVSPRNAPLLFDLKIDGVPAVKSTFLGPDMSPVESMPFEDAGRRNSRARGVPTETPEAPYFHIWYAGVGPGGETPVTLSDDTRRQLKALGYIQ